MSDASAQSPRARARKSMLVFDVDRPTLSSGLDLEEALAEALATDRDLVLDLFGVGEVDFAGLELLATARRSLRERGCELGLRNVCAGVQRVLELTGLEDGGTPSAFSEEVSRLRRRARGGPA